MTTTELVAPPAPAVRLAMLGISKKFGPATVLDDVTISVAPGEIHGLVGQNGAGKSTLMKILGGIHPDHEGTIEVDSATVGLSSPRDALGLGIGMIYQELSLIPGLTVAENIALGIEPGSVGYRKRDVLRLAAAVVDRSPLLRALPLTRLVGELGAGTQQMVEIAKALGRDARILVLDEPTARLSGPERHGLHALMRELAEAGTSMVYISHFLDEVLEITDRITVLRNGRVVAEGDTAAYDEQSLVRAMLSRELLAEEAVARRSHARDEVVLQLDELSVGTKVTGVDLAVHRGELVVITGLVGSGRTTLVSAIAGAQRPSSGSMRLGGAPVRFRSPRQASRAGLMFVAEDRKRNGIIPASSATDNLVLRAIDGRIGRRGWIGRRALERVARAEFERLDIQPRIPALEAGNFSGGNQQKLLIGRALLAHPRVLVVDQPTAGVDIGAKEQIHALLREAAANGAALLIVTDDIDEVLALADRVVVMKRGRVSAVEERESLNRDALVALISD